MNPSRNLAAAEFYSSVGRAEQALQEVEGHLADSPLDQAGLLLRSALLMEAGRLDEAEGAARQALAGDPQSAVALATLARVARLQSKWLPAEEWARQSLAVQESWLALNELGLALQHQGKVHEALHCFDDSLDLHWDEWTLYLRGHVLLEVDLDQAELAFQSLLEVDPRGLGLIGMSFVASGRGHFKKSIQLLERALANDPENATLQGIYAQAHIAQQVSTGPLGWRSGAVAFVGVLLSLWLSALVYDAWPAQIPPPHWLATWLQVSILAVVLRDAWQTLGFAYSYLGVPKFACVAGNLRPRYLTTALGWIALVAWHGMMSWSAIAQVTQVLLVHRLGLHYKISSVLLLLLPALLSSPLNHPPIWLLFGCWWLQLRLLRKHMSRVIQEWKG